MLTYQGLDGPIELLCEDYYIQEEWNGWEDTLHITLPKNHPQLPELLERTRLTDRESGQTYLITILDDNNITAALDLTELQADMLLGYTNGSATMSATIISVLPSGWTLSDHVSSTMQRTVTLDGGTPLDVIQQCVEKYSGLAVRFDTAARIVHLYWPTLADSSGAYYTDELNLTERPHFLGRSDEFYTRLYPIGADGLTIEDVNDGKPYVECHDYSDEIICAYWKDERYTDAASLLADAQAMVNEKGIPARSYTCPIVDLAKVDPDQYGHLTAEMYRVVTLIDRVRNRRVRHQIAQYRRYPLHPEKNTVTISTVPAKLSGRLSTVYAAVTDTAGKTDFAQRHEAAISAATALITGAKGGNVVVHLNAAGKPYEILIMDTDDIATAQNVWRYNVAGWGHSSTGYNGPYTLAGTMDGSINADMIRVGTLNANLITAGVLQSPDDGETFYLNLDTGELRLSPDGKDLATGDDLEELRAGISEQNTSILTNCEALIASALESYVETGDYEEFKQVMETQFSIMASEVSMNFTTTTEQITEVDGDLQSKFEQLYKYITFSEDGILIGSGDNAITLQLDNEDGIVFSKNGISFGRWDGVNFYTGNIVVEVNERAQFGNFAFVPRSDGSLSFLKVGG